MQRLPLDHRTHIVEHQPAHLCKSGQARLPGECHADQPAHAGAQPVQRASLQLRQ